ncbi:MAG: aldehyde dehydrogenase family protein [Pseudomonadota bacterium]
MSQALLLVDLQWDFIRRPGLMPSIEALQQTLSPLLAYARAAGIPVLHVRTEATLSPDNRMPHWQREDVRECIAGSEGAMPHPAFAEQAGEAVFNKRYFSGFGNAQLDSQLRSLDIDALWIAGLYTQSCVRSTAMDAYERGYRVVLVSDGLGSNDALHAGISLRYLDGRVATLASSAELMGSSPATISHDCPDAPGVIASSVVPSTRAETEACCELVSKAAADWALRPAIERCELLARFAGALADRGEGLLERMVRDIGKPITAARDELARAVGHVQEASQLEDSLCLEEGAEVVYEAHGVVALVTPWNNPVAIAAGKLAAALVLGNGVVWKPASQAARIAEQLLLLLHECGLPEALVQVVHGGAAEAKVLAADTHVAAVSLTGPEQAGMDLAAVCLPQGKALQAELGGNNALLVMNDADIESLAPVWAMLAFGFAGQRCTALRRFVVVRSACARFVAAIAPAIESLQLRSPTSPACQVGPMISPAARARAAGLVQAALDRGGHIVAGEFSRSSADCYFGPVVLGGLSREDPLVQEESFAPIAVLQQVDDYAEGMAAVNGVRQGLLAGIATSAESLYARFARGCSAGIVIDGGGLPLHPGAPFGGRKASQIGPPEHGAWDREFFARPKTLYRTQGK